MGPYEQYMLLDDSAAYPMTFLMAVEVSGDLQREAFESAVQRALERHPLCRCRVECLRGKGWCWTPVRAAAPQILWEESAIPTECLREDGIDLKREVGLRIRVHHERAKSRINFLFHHSTADGLGAMRFIGDALAIYGCLTAAPGEDVPELEKLNPQLLKNRARAWPRADDPQRGFLARAVYRIAETIVQMPVPLAAPRVAAPRLPGDAQMPAYIRRRFSREIYNGLKTQAAARGVSVNDLVVLETFRTIREWNRLYGRHKGREWYRIGVPVSLRTPLEDELPAANVLSFMFLTRRARHCDDEAGLLRYIHSETETVTGSHDRLLFTYTVRQLLKVPGLLAGMLGVPVCQATAIVSNVGDVRRQLRAKFPLKQGRCVAGNIRLEAVLGASPIRNKTRVGVSLGNYAGMLFVNVQCDPQVFSLAEAERLADMLATRIGARADTESRLKIAS
jgi:hypothetical protein